jgi:hypothetical protein
MKHNKCNCALPQPSPQAVYCIECSGLLCIDTDELTMADVLGAIVRITNNMKKSGVDDDTILDVIASVHEQGVRDIKKYAEMIPLGYMLEDQGAQVTFDYTRPDGTPVTGTFTVYWKNKYANKEISKYASCSSRITTA